MDAREAIALLAPGSIDFGKTYVVGGTALTPQDVAAAMATLCDTANFLLRAKYAGDSHHALFSSWYRSLKDKWGRDLMVSEVCGASLVDAVGSNRCPKCKGVGEQPIGSRVLVCSTCGGSGYWYDPKKFPKPWDERFQWCLGRLASIESAALGQVSARLT